MDTVDNLRPWMYEFEFSDGTKTPIMHESLRAIHAVRRSMIFELLAAIKFDVEASVLDLACNEGFFSFEFARRGAHDVLGIDERSVNIEKAEYVRDRIGLASCRFEVGDVTTMDLRSLEADVVLLLGIIYHVEDPVRLMRRAAQATRRMLIIETQLTKPQQSLHFGWGSPDARESPDVWAMLLEHNENQLASTRGFSLVPSASAVVSVLRDIGFRSILQLHPNDKVREPQYDHVDRAVFVAFR